MTQPAPLVVTATNVSGCAGTPIALSGSPVGGIYSVPNPYTGSSTTYTYSFTNVNGCSATSAPASINVNTCNTTLQLQLFIQGYYNGGQTMNPVLFNQGVTNLQTITDSIDVVLCSRVAPYTPMYSRRVVLNTNGTATAIFQSLNDTLYVVINGRNLLSTWSAQPVWLHGSSISYSFTDAASKAYGSNLIQVGSNTWACYSGDVNQDENMDLLDASLLEADVNAFLFGYETTDLNGDGNVDLLDTPLLENNINAFIFSNHP